MNQLIEEIIREANSGNIIIDGDDFPIGFHTIIYEENTQVFNNIKDNDFPVLVIKNKEKFLSKIEEYIQWSRVVRKKMPSFSRDVDRNEIKLLISYIFASATTEDFLNPIELLNRNISFLKDNTFNYISNGIQTPPLEYFDNSKLEIKIVEQSTFMETPKRIDITFSKDEEGELLKYNLPSLSFGISKNSKQEKVCFIYTVLHPKAKQEEKESQIKYSQKMSRKLYKINAGVSTNETEEYKKYVEGESDYYPENISDVSPSAILSLTVLTALLETENITHIKGVPFLPIRFLSRELMAQDKESSKAQEMCSRNIKLQQNITDKFIRQFRRLQYHMDGIEIQSFPYEVNEFLEIKINHSNHNMNNSILNSIYHSSIDALDQGKQNFKLSMEYASEYYLRSLYHLQAFETKQGGTLYHRR